MKLIYRIHWNELTDFSCGYLIFDSISKWELINEKEKSVFFVPHTHRQKEIIRTLARCFNTLIPENEFFPLVDCSRVRSFIWSIWLKICGDDWNYLIKHIARRITMEAHHVAIVLRHCQSCWVYVYKNLYRLMLMRVCDPKTNQRWKRIRLLLIFFLSHSFITQNDLNEQQQQRKRHTNEKENEKEH